jgi:hypothetical protein
MVGVRVIARDADRVRLLFDRILADEDVLSSGGLEILAQTPLTLEDLFVALVAK